MKQIFDVGMYDGADTDYYLKCGFKVVAVDANKSLIDSALKKFARQIESGQLTCINAAISPEGKPIELHFCGDDLGSSSLFRDRVADRRPAGAVMVPGITIDTLFTRFGIPEYLKIDIEGADRLCVLELRRGFCPKYLSFEANDDVQELIKYSASIGYKRFKVISQDSFRELANQRCFQERFVGAWRRYLKLGWPPYVWRAGRLFVTGHSSGPVPWRSDGEWHSVDVVLSRLQAAKAAGTLWGWHDIHAARD